MSSQCGDLLQGIYLRPFIIPLLILVHPTVQTPSLSISAYLELPRGHQNLTINTRSQIILKTMLLFTSRFYGLVVGFTDELLVVHQIEFVAGVELATAHGAGETFEVVDVILRSSYYLCWWNSLVATGALRPVTTAAKRMFL